MTSSLRQRVAALQKEGFQYWNAHKQILVVNGRVFVVYGTADGPALLDLIGSVGHSGHIGCRMRCPMPGRRRDGDSHYFPVMLCPVNYGVENCLHAHVTFKDLATYREQTPSFYSNGLAQLVTARTAADYARLRLKTGLCKISILNGLYDTLGLPSMLVVDIMHLACLNEPDLLLGLWRGTIKCYPPDNKDTWDWAIFMRNQKLWEAHGRSVEMAAKFLPSSFGRAPRDIAKKINTQYKAWEWIMYLYALGPALLEPILPPKYWEHFCKLVRGLRLLYQQKDISISHVLEATRCLGQFVKDFESLYYQQLECRLHFVRQSVHLLTHLGPESLRVGPLSCYAQWTMETIIGSLGNEIRSDKHPYANLANRALLRAQVNALCAQYPHIQTPLTPASGTHLSQWAKETGTPGYYLLPRSESAASTVSDAELCALADLWISMGWGCHPHAIIRWARLLLSNGQVTRSRWLEVINGKQRPKYLPTRNLKLCIDGKIKFAEALYFFCIRFDDGTLRSFAMVSMYQSCNPDMLRRSQNTVHLCRAGGDDDISVVPVDAIQSLVGMVPRMKATTEGEVIVFDDFVLVEEPGLPVGVFQDAPDEGDGLEGDGMEN